MRAMSMGEVETKLAILFIIMMFTHISSVNPNPPRVMLVLSVVSYVQVVSSQSPGLTFT